VVQFAIAVADAEPVVPSAPEVACGDLLELFRLVSGGRPGQGRDHLAAAVLALAAAAVVAGMRGHTAVAGWVKDVPPPVLADLHMRAGASPARPPSRAAIWRVLTDQASPAGRARYARGQWATEPWHRLRGTLYQQDKSRVRTRSGPKIMAALPVH